MYGEIQNCFQQGWRSCPKPYGIELFGGWEQFVVLPRAPLKGELADLAALRNRQI